MFNKLKKEEKMKKINDPFGFTKAINFKKLNNPKVLKELEKIFLKGVDEGNGWLEYQTLEKGEKWKMDKQR